MFKDANGRYVFLSLEIGNSLFSLINIYAHNILKERNLFFDTIYELLRDNNTGISIIAGDFNETLGNLQN